MVQLIAALFFTAALFAAIGVIAVTLQKSGSQILAALRGVMPAAATASRTTWLLRCMR